MLINIFCPMKKDEVRKLLENNEVPKYTFVKMKTPMEMQFEVTYPEGVNGDPISYAKKLIKAQPYGQILTVRILVEGKDVSWDNYRK